MNSRAIGTGKNSPRQEVSTPIIKEVIKPKRQNSRVRSVSPAPQLAETKGCIVCPTPPKKAWNNGLIADTTP